MAAEPPNDRMDDLLKSVAKKRQDEAGEPFTLHPATRKLLQGEVTRTYSKAPSQSRWARLLTFWPRIGFAAATLAILLTVMLIVIPNAEREHELARNVPPGAPAPVEPATYADFSPREESLQKKDSSGAKNEREVLMSESLSRSSDQKQVVKELDGVTLADKPSTPAASTRPMERKRQPAPTDAADREKSAERMVELRAAEQPAKAGQVASVSQVVDSNAVMLGTQLHFYSINTDVVSRAQYVQVPAQTPALAGVAVAEVQPVLASFEFEQTGDQVRITDADGSVYQGQVVTNMLGDVAGGALGRDVRQVEAGKKLTEAKRALDESQTQYRFFRAAGTNRTLHKLVTIEANLPAPQQAQATSAPVANAPAGRSDSQRDSFGSRGLQTLPQIRGRAQIGTNQQVLIQAVPAQK